MRICHYPGRAVDATLSLDQKSPMESIYKSNWLNADKTIKTIGRNSAAAKLNANNAISIQSNNQMKNGKSLDNIYLNHSSGSSAQPSSSSSDEENRRNSHCSSLGRYQMTLEEMQKLDLNQSSELFKKTMRNLNGYKPSTIRQKHRRYHNDWNENQENGHEAQIQIDSNKTQANKMPADFNNDDFQLNGIKYDAYSNDKIVSIPKIKRSQTVRYPSTTSNSPHKINNLNIRNMFNQKNNLNKDNAVKMPTATINKNFNRLKRSNLMGSQHELYTPNAENNVDFQSPNNKNNNNNNHVATNCTDKLVNEYVISSNFNRFKNRPNSSIEHEQQKSNLTCDNDMKQQQQQNKSLFHVKSVRINPTPLQDIHYDRSAHENRYSLNCDNQARNGCNESAMLQQQQKLQQLKQKLPRLTSIMKKKSDVIQTNNKSQEQSKAKPMLFQWIDYHKKQKQQQQQPVEIQNSNVDMPKSTKSQNRNEFNKSKSSLSSTSSSSCGDSNSNVSDFSIPRPRLIVPVHTYARKRRTGNLIQSQTGDAAQINDDPVVMEQLLNHSSNAKNNGKIQLHEF